VPSPPTTTSGPAALLRRVAAAIIASDAAPQPAAPAVHSVIPLIRKPPRGNRRSTQSAPVENVAFVSGDAVVTQPIWARRWRTRLSGERPEPLAARLALTSVLPDASVSSGAPAAAALA
jgi:hypothetical protein